MTDTRELIERLDALKNCPQSVADMLGEYLTPNELGRLYNASEAMHDAHTALSAALEREKALRRENAALRHWSVGHIDALLLYAGSSYPNDSHVRDAVEFCRIVAPKHKLRIPGLQGSGWHPASAALSENSQ